MKRTAQNLMKWIKWIIHPNHTGVHFLLALIAISAFWHFFPSLQHIQIYGVLVTAIVGLFFFRAKQHLDKARFFKELVVEFCQRYDKLNDNLFDALGKEEQDFDAREKMAFMDYFNLCAEEYLFYKEGYIYKCVWEAWQKGMEQFGQDKRVKALWEKERKTLSYYGFEFPCQNDEIPLPPQTQRR